MIYGSNEKGEGILTLTPEEKAAFESGQKVTRISGDRLGRFTITAKLTRPNSRAKRFPVAEYGENYEPNSAPVISASQKLMEDRHEYMRQVADELLGDYDFGSDVVADTWEWDSGEPNVIVCTIYFENQDDPSGDSIMARFSVDFRGDKPIVEVY